MAGCGMRRSAVAGCIRRKTPRSRSQSRPRAAKSARMVAVVMITEPSMVSMCDLLWRTGKRFDMSIPAFCAGVGLWLVVTRDLSAGGVCRSAKNLRKFLGALGKQRDVIADADAGEEVLDITLAQAEAAVFEQDELAVGDADNDAANRGGLRGCG